MNLRHLAASITISAAVLGGAGLSVSPVHAQGKSYGCTINPKAPACVKGATSTTVNGSVNGVANTQPAGGSNQAPAALPTTGGGIPSGPADGIFALLAGLGLTVAGFALRRRSVN